MVLWSIKTQKIYIINFNSINSLHHDLWLTFHFWVQTKPTESVNPMFDFTHGFSINSSLWSSRPRNFLNCKCFHLFILIYFVLFCFMLLTLLSLCSVYMSIMIICCFSCIVNCGQYDPVSSKTCLVSPTIGLYSHFYILFWSNFSG